MSRAIDCYTPDTRFKHLECDDSSSMVRKTHVSFTSKSSLWSVLFEQTMRLSSSSMPNIRNRQAILSGTPYNEKMVPETFQTRIER